MWLFFCFDLERNYDVLMSKSPKQLSVGARERKKKVFFVPFILSLGNFFNICVLSQCIVY